MITVTQALDQIVRETAFLEEALSKKIINLSGLARMLQTHIEEITYKKPTIGALVMALKRLKPLIVEKNNVPQHLKKLTDLTVRSNLIEYALYNGTDLPFLFRTLSKKAELNKTSFINFTHGVSESILVVSRNLESEVEKVIEKKHIIGKIQNLSSITLKLSPEHIYTPGIQYALLKTLAWNNINIIETLSSYSEITILLETRFIDRAFSAIKNLTF